MSSTPIPINQFTDLSGARVIVQTTDQVKGVCEFITQNFIICEADNKEILLGTDRFGYRDMHHRAAGPKVSARHDGGGTRGDRPTQG